MVGKIILGFLLIACGGVYMGYAYIAFPLQALPFTGQGVACAIFFYISPMALITMGLCSGFDACVHHIDKRGGYHGS